jgi:hypothetical protein
MPGGWALPVSRHETGIPGIKVSGWTCGGSPENREKEGVILRLNASARI